MKEHRSGAWASWLADCLVRLLAVDFLSVAVLAIVVGGIDTDSLLSWVLLWGVFSYIGFFVGAVVYLPLLLISTSFTRRWRLVALALSPIVAAGALLFFVPWSMGDPALIVWAVGTAAAVGAIVPAPGEQSLRRGFALAAGSAAIAATTLFAFG